MQILTTRKPPLRGRFLNSGRKGFESATMVLVTWVVFGYFAPKGVGMIHVVKMSKLVNDYIVAENFGNIHEADVERNGAIARTTAPTCGGVREPAFIIAITVEFGVIFEAIREIRASLFHEDFLFGITGALSSRVVEGNFFADKSAVDV